jgi:hypothetical protein
LVATPKYDFNWQRSYAFDQSYDDLPSLGPGDTLTMTFGVFVVLRPLIPGG